MTTHSLLRSQNTRKHEASVMRPMRRSLWRTRDALVSCLVSEEEENGNGTPYSIIHIIIQYLRNTRFYKTQCVTGRHVKPPLLLREGDASIGEENTR
jgi:hypothetical protein